VLFIVNSFFEITDKRTVEFIAALEFTISSWQ